MNIKSFLKKMAQIADFQQSTAEPVIEEPQGQPLPEAGQGLIDNGIAQTGPLSPIQQSPQMIQTDIAEWHPSRGRNKGQTYYYLQLINVNPTLIDPTSSTLYSHLTNIGYKFNAKFKSWSKQIKADNSLKINLELDSIEQNFNVPVNREAIQKLQTIFGFDDDTSTEMGTGEISDDVKKIKFIEEDKQQEAAKNLLKNKLEKMAENLDSEETKKFLEQYLSVQKATQGKVHPYSFLNSMLISWQNYDVDEEGKSNQRSGFIAPASLWEKEFGRTVNSDAQGMEIFVPKGGKKTMKGGGQASLLKFLGQFTAMNGGYVDLTVDDNIRKMFGFLKSLVAKKKMYDSNYSYLVNKFNKNKEQFKSVKDITDYLGNMLNNKQEDSYYVNTTFLIKPVIFDIDQTSVIPGQEGKDPKPRMEAIRGMWLGLKNEPDKLIDTLYTALADSAVNGFLIPDKKINIKTENTGSAGGWSSGGEIAIDQASGGERRFRTLVHESAHEILHWGSERSGYSGKDKEIEADATAYLVLNHFGVGTGSESLNYISMLTKNKEDVMGRLEPILKASNTIIAAIEKQKSMEYDQSKSAQTNWYKSFKFAHYSEPESKGEGYGGDGQFGERRLDDWGDEHRVEVKKMSALIQSMNWVSVEEYKQELMGKYNSPENVQIINGIVSSAMSGQRF